MITGVSDALDAPDTEQDHRAWQHGVNLIQVGDKVLVVWGSAGNPPQPNLGGDWQHDVYYAWLETRSVQGATRELAPIRPQVLVSMPEAQEPPSVAINSRGTLLMTSEDGNGGINQNAGLWDNSLRPLRTYPFTIQRGGHSGHAASMRDRFLVAYSEGWVDGGGWLGLGTGENVYARIVENDGTRRKQIKVASGHRDGWPLVAGSDRNWLVVWQRYPERTLQSALIGASGKVLKRMKIIGGLPMRYSYDVEFAPSLEAYAVAGSSGEGGFVSLVSLTGEVVRTNQKLPPMASESRLVLARDGTQVIGVYPVRPRGIAVVRITADAVDLVRVVEHPHTWDYAGTTGMFVAPERMLFATLSTTGLRLFVVNIAP